MAGSETGTEGESCPAPGRPSPAPTLTRGFVSEANEILLQEARTPFILPQRHNSTRYENRIHLTDHFVYHRRMIHTSKHEEDR